MKPIFFFFFCGNKAHFPQKLSIPQCISVFYFLLIPIILKSGYIIAILYYYQHTGSKGNANIV